MFVRNGPVLTLHKSAPRNHDIYYFFLSLHVRQVKGASLQLQQVSELRRAFWKKSRGHYGLPNILQHAVRVESVLV